MIKVNNINKDNLSKNWKKEVPVTWHYFDHCGWFISNDEKKIRTRKFSANIKSILKARKYIQKI